MKSSVWQRVAALFGLTGVGLGAFGAHALKEILEQNQTAETWKTGVLYQLIHAVALLVLAQGPRIPRLAVILFSAGILLFSGSLYLYSLAPVSGHAAVFLTPVGGLCFLGGWLAIVLARA